MSNTDRTDAPLRLLSITETEQASGGNPLLAAAFAFGLVTGYVGGGDAITKSIDVKGLLSQK